MWTYLRTSITDIKLICRFGVIREEVAIICVRNFLLTEGKVYKFMFIPVLFCLVLMFLLFLLKHFHRTYIHLWVYLCHVNFCFQQCYIRVYRAEDTGGHCGRKWVLCQCRHTTFFWSVFQSPAYLTSLLPSMLYAQIAIIKPSTMPEFPIRKAKWMLIRSDFSSTAKWVLYTTGQSYNQAVAGVT